MGTDRKEKIDRSAVPSASLRRERLREKTPFGSMVVFKNRLFYVDPELASQLRDEIEQMSILGAVSMSIS